jgi:hypothetical protein
MVKLYLIILFLARQLDVEPFRAYVADLAEAVDVIILCCNPVGLGLVSAYFFCLPLSEVGWCWDCLHPACDWLNMPCYSVSCMPWHALGIGGGTNLLMWLLLLLLLLPLLLSRGLLELFNLLLCTWLTVGPRCLFLYLL